MHPKVRTRHGRAYIVLYTFFYLSIYLSIVVYTSIYTCIYLSILICIYLSIYRLRFSEIGQVRNQLRVQQAASKGVQEEHEGVQEVPLPPTPTPNPQPHTCREPALQQYLTHKKTPTPLEPP